MYRIRLTEAWIAKVDAAASTLGQTRSAFMRQATWEKARQTLEETNTEN